jgi:hypothetical protein
MLLRVSNRLFFTLLVAVLSSSMRAQAQPCAGVTLPAQVDAFGVKLKRNGVGLREASFLNVDVYVAGLYLESPSKDVSAVIDKQATKAIMLHFVRDVSRDDMVKAIDEALKKNVGASFGMVQKHMSAFVSKLPEFRKGTRLSIAYRPNHGVELRVNGKSLGVDTDSTFGNLLFQAWLGKNPPDVDLKQGLLGGVACQ